MTIPVRSLMQKKSTVRQTPLRNEDRDSGEHEEKSRLV
jgi:hypothetical protein